MKRTIIIGAVAAALIQATSDSMRAQGRAASADSHESRIQANGISIAYRSYGSRDRETVLLIMGVGGQLMDWPAELPAELVKRGYRVVTYDNRDAGLSTRFEASGLPDWPGIFAALAAGKTPQVAYTLEDMASDAIGLLDAEDPSRPSRGRLNGRHDRADCGDQTSGTIAVADVHDGRRRQSGLAASRKARRHGQGASGTPRRRSHRRAGARAGHVEGAGEPRLSGR